jgi:hypothetical protein
VIVLQLYNFIDKNLTLLCFGRVLLVVTDRIQG